MNRKSTRDHEHGPVEPIAWIVRHKADKPGDIETIYRWEEDAVRHAASFRLGIARVIAVGDIAGAMTAERERHQALIEQCRNALAEELAAWDIEPPPHHVKAAHDSCVEWLEGTSAGLSGSQREERKWCAKKPFTAEQLDKLIEAYVGGDKLADGEYGAMVLFATFIERAHGIGI